MICRIFELTIQDGKLGCSSAAWVNVQVLPHSIWQWTCSTKDLSKEKTSVLRVQPVSSTNFYHPILDPKSEKRLPMLLPRSSCRSGGSVGQIVFTAEDAVAWAAAGKKVILVREVTNPEDVEGMRAGRRSAHCPRRYDITRRLVARGWGKCCIVGCDAVHLNVHKKELTIAGN